MDIHVLQDRQLAVQVDMLGRQTALALGVQGFFPDVNGRSGGRCRGQPGQVGQNADGRGFARALGPR
jgi:hypothetical protein